MSNPIRSGNPSVFPTPEDQREYEDLRRRMDAGVTEATPLVCVLLPSLDSTPRERPLATSSLHTRLGWKASGAILLSEICAIAEALPDHDREAFYGGMAECAADRPLLLLAILSLARARGWRRPSEQE